MSGTDKLSQRVAGYLLKYDSDVFDELSAEDWIRADVESFEGVSPSERDGIIATGVHMVRAAIRNDRVTKRYAGLDVIRSR